MVFTEAKYLKNSIENINVGISCKIDGVETSIPIDPANRHYAAILEWAKIDGNTIEDAD